MAQKKKETIFSEILPVKEEAKEEIKEISSVRFIAPKMEEEIIQTKSVVIEPIKVKVINGNLIIHSAPNKESEKIGTLKNGEVISVLEMKNGFYKLEQKDGYINSSFVVKI